MVVNSPGWERVKASFFDWDNFAESAPGIIAAFRVNIALFLTAEVLILLLGLVLAVLRNLSGPVLYPLRLLATVYVDVFRAPGHPRDLRARLRDRACACPASPATRSSGASWR